MIHHDAMIHHLPRDERPRERLLVHGPHTLSDAELIAILLRTGRPGTSALGVARELLHSCGGLPGLLSSGCRALRRKGLGEAKAAALLAAVELGRRVARCEMPARHPLHRPSDAARYLAMRYAVSDQEVMGALYLDSRCRLIAERELFRGTINRVAVEPRALLKEGLLQGASNLLLFHTHPSGDPRPSLEDLTFTRRLAEAGEIVGVTLVDHLILGSTNRWISLRERGAW